MKVYLVTSGEYSDYEVEGVFLTREEAEEVQEEYGFKNDLEEFEVGEMLDWVRRDVKLYRVILDIQSGDIGRVFLREERYAANFNDKEFKVRVKETFISGRLQVDVWARNKEDAIKIAVEKRQSYLRNESLKGAGYGAVFTDIDFV